MEKILKVEGMQCGHCKAHVEKALGEVAGVVSAQVDLDAGTATVALTGEVSDAILKDAVENAGYTVASIAEK